MGKNEFVQAIKSYVRDSAISNTIKNLIQPTGKVISQEQANLSQWYKNLSNCDKESLSCVLQNAVDSSIFGLLAVIDGSRVIDEGSFELFHVKNNERTLLNGESGDYLHEIYQHIKSENHHKQFN